MMVRCVRGVTGAGLLFADTLVYVSSNQRRHWRRRGVRARRDTVILNGVDPVRFARPSPATRMAARAALGLEPDEVGVVLCSRFRPEKNHGQLLEAVAACARAAARSRGGVEGALFPAGSTPDLIAALDTLAGAEVRRARGAAARARMEREFTETRMVDEYETVLRAVAARGRLD